MIANATSATVSSGTVQFQIGLSFLSLGLLVFTSLLSYYSYSAQARTGIRESLEQLDDVEINNKYKLKAILHEFDFGPLNPKSTILIKLYKTQFNEAAASIPETGTDQINQEMMSEIREEIAERDLDDIVLDSYVDAGGIHFELSTRNAVGIRRFANQLMTVVRNSWLDSE